MRHFYQNEFVLRQTCDWCRFLWTYKEKIDIELLEKRLKRAGLVAEWKAFAAFAVDYLGMPVEAMPLYDSRFKVLGRAKRHSRAKDGKVLKRILKSGNVMLKHSQLPHQSIANCHIKIQPPVTPKYGQPPC